MGPVFDPGAGAKPTDGEITKSAFAPQPSGKLVHAWDRAPVKAHAPRLEGKKVWKKKLLKILGAGDKEVKLQQAQAELSKDGAGSRKKRRTSGTKQLIRDAEWMGTEWEGFGNDIMKDVAQSSSQNTKEDMNENDATPITKKRRANDKIVTPRKPLRRVTINKQSASSIESGQETLDDAVAIAKRSKRAVRKSGFRISMAVEENTEAAPQSEAQAALPILDSIQHARSAERATSATNFMSPSQISPRKRIAMRKSGLSAAAVLGTAKRASIGETRRLSGALFAEASPTTVVTAIDFGTTTATSMEFGKNSPAPVGTPVRTRIVPPMPKTAPAKIQPTRSEIEQEMASFFTPIPRLKKVKRRSSPIKSYLQQLLENQGTPLATTNYNMEDKMESITPEMQVDSPLGFRSIAAVASPKETSSPCPVEHKIGNARIELTRLSADAKEVRLDPNLVPDLSISRKSAIADSESEEENLDTEDEDVSIVRDESICADEDPEDQLRAELAAQHSREPSPATREIVQPVADAETPEVHDEDDLMLDVADEPSSEPADVSSCFPVFTPSSFTAETGIPTVATNPEAPSSDSDSNEPAINSAIAAVTSYEDEETAMLLAFITKNQAKKLSRTSPKGKIAASPPILSVISGNASPSPKKVAKSSSSSKKSKNAASETLSEIPSFDAPDVEAPSAAESTSVRRSTRASKLPTVKSGIPAPSFIPVRLGTDEVKVPVKKEKTLEQITKLNTGKNKAGCLQPVVVLKRLKDQESKSRRAKKGSASPDVAAKEDEQPRTGKDGKPKKNLVWAAVVAHIREFDEKDCVRPAAKEKKDTKSEKSKTKKGDEKPADGAKKMRVGTASERASKIALGMGANGTPAKPMTATKRKLREPSAGKDKDGEIKEKEEKKIKQPRLTKKDGEVKEGEKKEEVNPTQEKKVRQPRLKSPKKVTAAKKASLAV